MKALVVNTGEFHVVEYRLVKESGWKALLILLFAKISREELTGALKDAEVYDVVVIDVFYIQAIVVDCMACYLILSGVDGNIEVIPIVLVGNNSIILHDIRQRQYLCLLFFKELFFLSIVFLNQFDDFSISTLEPQHVLRMLLDVVT
jgi:hypothetical protein